MDSLEKNLRDDLQNTTFKLRQTEVEERRLAATKERLQIIIDYIKEKLESNQPVQPLDGDGDGVQPSADNVESNGKLYSHTGTRETVEAVLRRTGRPMRVADIVEEALHGGFGGPSVDKKKVEANIASVLARAVYDEEKNPHPVFQKVGRGLFTVKPAVEATD